MAELPGIVVTLVAMVMVMDRKRVWEVRRPEFNLRESGLGSSHVDMLGM